MKKSELNAAIDEDLNEDTDRIPCRQKMLH